MTKAKRFQTNETAVVEVYGRIGMFKAQLKNISQTGAYLEWIDAPYEIAEGDILRLTVHLSEVQKSRNFSAELIWKKSEAGGVCFIMPEEVIDKMMSKV